MLGRSIYSTNLYQMIFTMPNMIQACSDFDGAPVCIVNTRPDKVSLEAWGVPPDLLLKSPVPQDTALGGCGCYFPRSTGPTFGVYLRRHEFTAVGLAAMYFAAERKTLMPKAAMLPRELRKFLCFISAKS